MKQRRVIVQNLPKTDWRASWVNLTLGVAISVVVYVIWVSFVEALSGCLRGHDLNWHLFAYDDWYWVLHVLLGIVSGYCVYKWWDSMFFWIIAIIFLLLFHIFALNFGDRYLFWMWLYDISESDLRCINYPEIKDFIPLKMW